MSGGHEIYIRRVQEETQRYAQTLLAENERLRSRLAAAEARIQPLEEQARAAQALQAANESLRSENASLAAAQTSVREQIASLREGLARAENARRDVEDRLKNVEDENHRFSQEYLEIEQQNSNLANLYVASLRLHETLDRAELLKSIQEIVANLIGSEEMGLFELDTNGGLSLVSSFGIQTKPFDRVSPGAGLIGRVARDGKTHLTQRDGLADARPEEAELTACIPLKLAGRVTGVLALFRLLPQKSGLVPLDQELFDLLADQAAIALHCTALHERFAARTN
jgi:hypothetical protein